MPDNYGVIGFYAESDMSQFAPAGAQCDYCEEWYYENEPACWNCETPNPNTGMY